jgi:hypothetical protein
MLLDHPVGAIWFTADPAILLLIGRNPAAIPKNPMPYVAPDSLRALSRAAILDCSESTDQR